VSIATLKSRADYPSNTCLLVPITSRLAAFGSRERGEKILGLLPIKLPIKCGLAYLYNLGNNLDFYVGKLLINPRWLLRKESVGTYTY